MDPSTARRNNGKSINASAKLSEAKLSKVAVCHRLVGLSTVLNTFIQSSKNSIMGKKSASKKTPPPELTEDQKQEIREAFDLFDQDGSG